METVEREAIEAGSDYGAEHITNSYNPKSYENHENKAPKSYKETSGPQSSTKYKTKAPKTYDAKPKSYENKPKTNEEPQKYVHKMIQSKPRTFSNNSKGKTKPETYTNAEPGTSGKPDTYSKGGQSGSFIENKPNPYAEPEIYTKEKPNTLLMLNPNQKHTKKHLLKLKLQQKLR